MKTTTEMQLVPITKLVPYVNNARTHSPEQINKLRSSLREFGFINPVIIDRDYGVIAGHGRILAAKEEGISEVPCVFADHLTEAQKKAYIIADNRMAMDAGWDEELLRVEIESLQAADFDPLLTGFDEKELSKLFDDGIDAEEDDFDVDAELQKPTFTKFGDIWTLGRHRLICGDSTKGETYTALMDGRKANLVITDPPYNVNYEGSAGKIKNDNMASEKFFDFLFDTRRESRVTDVCIEFYEEVATYDHRLCFGVIDIGGNDGAAAGNFVANELRSYVRIDAQHFVLKVLPYGYILHFGGDDALFGIVHLRDFFPLFGTIGQVQMFETYLIEAFVCLAHTAVLRCDALKLLHVATVGNPRLPQAGKTFFEVDFYRGIGIYTAGVVDIYGVVMTYDALSIYDVDCIGEIDFAHGNPYIV